MCGAKAWDQEAVPPAEDVWATSPTTVNDFVGPRRIRDRQLMGECSWASSTTTCPYVQLRSAEDRSARVRPSRTRAT